MEVLQLQGRGKVCISFQTEEGSRRIFERSVSGRMSREKTIGTVPGKNKGFQETKNLATQKCNVSLRRGNAFSFLLCQKGHCQLYLNGILFHFKDENVLHLEHNFHIWGFEDVQKNVCKYLQHCFDHITFGKESQSKQRLSAQSLISQHKQSQSIFFPMAKC